MWPFPRGAVAVGTTAVKKVLSKYLKLSLRGTTQIMRGDEEGPQDRAWGDTTFLQSSREENLKSAAGFKQTPQNDEMAE